MLLFELRSFSLLSNGMEGDHKTGMFVVVVVGGVVVVAAVGVVVVVVVVAVVEVVAAVVVVGVVVVVVVVVVMVLLPSSLSSPPFPYHQVEYSVLMGFGTSSEGISLEEIEPISLSLLGNIGE